MGEGCEWFWGLVWGFRVVVGAGIVRGQAVVVVLKGIAGWSDVQDSSLSVDELDNLLGFCNGNDFFFVAVIGDMS